MEDQGIPFERSFHPDKVVFLQSTQGLMWSGNEKVWPYRTIATPVPRGHQVAMAGDAAGAGAMQPLLARCAEEGVRASFATLATALLIDEDGSCRGAAELGRASGGERVCQDG